MLAWDVDLSLNLAVPDLLFITHRVPYPPDKGDRIRTYHLLRFLSRHFRVHLASFADESVGEETITELKRLTARFEFILQGRTKWLGGLKSLTLGGSISEGIYHDSRMVKLLSNWKQQTRFHGVVLSASSLASYLKYPGFDSSINVVDFVDVDSQKWIDYATSSSIPKSWLYRLEGRRLRQTEIAISDEVDAVTLVSERETELVRSYCPPQKIHKVTNGVDLEYYSPRVGQNCNRLIFVGALDYKPNVEGICWFAREVWPKLTQRIPGLELQIVGRKPVKSVLQLESVGGIKVIGQVPDVRPFMADSKLIIAPLMIARGLQNKVLEAMAFGKPVVGSAASLAGFAHTTDFPGVQAGSPDEWVHEITAILESESRRDELGKSGRKYAERLHNWNDCLLPFTRLLKPQHSEPSAEASS